jgi:hypothetical protein
MKGQAMRLASPRPAPAFFAFVLLAVCATARGEEEHGVWFQHGDWEIVCDNTLTCRMAGYCAGKNHDQGWVSVLMTRAAGPNAPLAGKAVILLDDLDVENEKYPTTLALWIDGRFQGRLGALENAAEGGDDFPLTLAQIRALLAAAREGGMIEFVGDTKSFTLSGRGIAAVLLKADEAQGRVGTPGALIKKGNRPEKNVFPPRPKPVIRAAKVSKALSRNLTAPEIAALKPVLLQDKKMREACNAALDEFTLTPLDERHVLISALCWRDDEYNEGRAYWTADSALENSPRLVTHRGSGYDEGEIYAQRMERKQGDCWRGRNWLWDGEAFRLSSQWTSGKCRRISAGGAWKLPAFVTDIINADGTPRAPD